jgi:hypothetical protein
MPLRLSLLAPCAGMEECRFLAKEAQTRYVAWPKTTSIFSSSEADHRRAGCPHCRRARRHGDGRGGVSARGHLRIRGCVPKKLFVYASRFHGEFEDAAGFGWTVSQSSFDWTTLVANTDREIGRLEAAYGATLEKAGVKVVKDRAVLADAHTVQLANGRACAPAMCSSRLARGRAMAKQSPAWSTLFPRTRRSICPSFRGVF